MRRPTAAALALAALPAAPATAGAKGVVAMSVCGANGCHRVEPAAVRDGEDGYARAAAPDSAEPFFIVRARARVSSGRVVEAFTLDWLPSSGVTRTAYGERSWTRPPVALGAAFRRAARGLRPHPAADRGSVADRPPAARVVEVLAPREDNAHRGPGGPAIAGALALAALLGVTLSRRR
jgi:hypothetical protein